MSFAEYTSVLAAKFLARLRDDQTAEEALLERLDDIWAELSSIDRARVKVMSAKIADGELSRNTFAVDFAKFEAQQQLSCLAPTFSRLAQPLPEQAFGDYQLYAEE